ncbi:MAG: N-acetylglucosamine kinase [Proteobacteria bacterium]|nr:N-acetylglucosamine kinase [Pseudomonadota bacterium]
MKTFLGVDGGGTKTRFLLIDETGKVLASHLEGPAYYLEIGLERLREMLACGIEATLRQARVREADLSYAFLGLPAHGEDSKLLPVLDAAPLQALPHGRYRCGNDMVCGWAGALAGSDGINIVSGTGSIAYGEYAGRGARAGGWGELFSDEGSSYWLAREGLRLFSRMSDGRSPRGPLYERVRRHFALQVDLDLCAAIYGNEVAQRSQLAQLSKLVTAAAAEGDRAALELFSSAACELADLVDAVRGQLGIPRETAIPVSCSGGMFQAGNLLREPLESQLRRRSSDYRFIEPLLPPEVGAAIQAAKLNGTPLGPEGLRSLQAKKRDG